MHAQKAHTNQRLLTRQLNTARGCGELQSSGREDTGAYGTFDITQAFTPAACQDTYLSSDSYDACSHDLVHRGRYARSPAVCV